MKVNKEDFKKLKQLDRIEYLLKKDRIEKNNKYEVSSTLFLALFLGMGTIIILLFYQIFGDIDSFYFLVSLFKMSCFILCLIYVFDILLDLYFYLRKNKELKQLFEDYFKVEVKK